MLYWGWQQRTTKTSEIVYIYANSVNITVNNNFMKHLYRVHISKKIKQVTC